MTNNYESYRTARTEEQYFSNWESDQLDNLSEEHKKQIYGKYIVKCAVFQRDNFKCTNLNCEFPESKLTLHHIKFKKNNGRDTIRNCSTLCHACHKGFHRGKYAITINNMTYQIHKEESINWKEIKAQSKLIRLNHPECKNITISFELMVILMRFLQIPYTDFEDDI